MNDKKKFFVCEYEGKKINKVWMYYENNGSILKVKEDKRRSIIGNKREMKFMKRKWEMENIEIMNVLSVNMEEKENEGYMVV